MQRNSTCGVSDDQFNTDPNRFDVGPKPLTMLVIPIDLEHKSPDLGKAFRRRQREAMRGCVPASSAPPKAEAERGRLRRGA